MTLRNAAILRIACAWLDKVLEDDRRILSAADPAHHDRAAQNLAQIVATQADCLGATVHLTTHPARMTWHGVTATTTQPGLAIFDAWLTKARALTPDRRSRPAAGSDADARLTPHSPTAPADLSLPGIGAAPAPGGTPPCRRGIFLKGPMMADRTTIEWTDATWNPIRGCTRVSEGCRNCYAEVMAARFSAPGQWGHGLAQRVALLDCRTNDAMPGAAHA